MLIVHGFPFHQNVGSAIVVGNSITAKLSQKSGMPIGASAATDGHLLERDDRAPEPHHEDPTDQLADSGPHRDAGDFRTDGDSWAMACSMLEPPIFQWCSADIECNRLTTWSDRDNTGDLHESLKRTIGVELL
jgi:hypothetical protein